MEKETERIDLAIVASKMYDRGWMPGLSGNLSCRRKDGQIWVSGHGTNKRDLAEKDFVLVSGAGKILDPVKDGPAPSSELDLHLAVYKHFPQAAVCVHLHMLNALLAAHFSHMDEIAIPPIETVRDFGLVPGEGDPMMAVFPNHSSSSETLKMVASVFSKKTSAVPAFLIRNHGIMLWAPDAETAYSHADRFNFIFQYKISAKHLEL